MRIERVEVVPYALTFRERYRTASGEIDRREMALLRLHTDTGPVGLGECVPLSLRGGRSLDLVVADLRGACAETLRGRECGAVDAIDERLSACRTAGAGAEAIAAVDIALHDLAGKALGVPIWRLLGAKSTEPAACNATLDAGEPAIVADHACEARAAGFAVFKVKVGIDEDRARVAAVREAIGEEAKIRLDANGAFSVEQAESLAADLEPLEIELFEQPCATAEELGRLRRLIEIPIVADESVASIADAKRARELEACDAVTAKLSKVGGIIETLRIADVLPTYLSSALDGPVGIAAALHTTQALRRGTGAGFAHGLATAEMFSTWPQVGPALHGPLVAPPSGPGLGIEIDEQALERLRL